jgi:hypothetical protein
VYLKFPTELVSLVLSTPEAGLRFQHEWDYNDGYIDTQLNTDGWLYDSAYFRDFIVNGYYNFDVC